jgi:dephospho-CoA kinase
MNNSEELQRKVKNYFGEEVLDEHGNVDRTKLGEVIFNDRVKRNKLNSFTHPMIFKRMIRELISKRFQRSAPLVCIDAPLLYESKFLQYFCYPIMVVYVEDSEL